MLHLHTIDRMDDATVWTALSNDTTGLAASASRITGNYSLEFDKVNGTDNSTIAGASRSLVLNLDEDAIQLHDKIQWSIYISALTAVASCHIKLGTDVTNNLQWTVADTQLNAGWNLCTAVVGAPSAINGTGWDPTAITYMEVGVTFDAETDALANVRVDSVSVVPSRYTEDNTEISMDGAAISVDTDALEALVTAGNVDLAAIDVLNTSIKTAVELLDNVVAVHDAAAAGSSYLMGGKYEAAPTERDDGDQGPVSIGPFNRVETANQDRSTGTGLVTDFTSVSGVPFQPGAWTQLTAPGVTVAVDTTGYEYITVAVTLAAVDTTAVVSVEGSVDGTNYGTADLVSTAVAGAAYAAHLVTLTVNGTYLLKVLPGAFKKIRLNFSSETGGTACTIDATPMASN